MLTLPKLTEMVKQAMPPQQRRQLEEAGELAQVAADRAEAAWETRALLRHQARDEAATSNLSYQETVQNHYMKNLRADQIAIYQATERIPAMPTGPEELII